MKRIKMNIERLSMTAMMLVILMFASAPLFAAGAQENTPEERSEIEALVGEFAETTIADETERDQFNRVVLAELADRLVDVQGLAIALAAFDITADPSSGRAFADAVLERIDRTEQRLYRGESPHRVSAESRFEQRAGIPAHVSGAGRDTEFAASIRERVEGKLDEIRIRIPSAPAGPDLGL